MYKKTRNSDMDIGTVIFFTSVSGKKNCRFFSSTLGVIIIIKKFKTEKNYNSLLVNLRCL